MLGKCQRGQKNQAFVAARGDKRELIADEPDEGACFRRRKKTS